MNSNQWRENSKKILLCQCSDCKVKRAEAEKREGQRPKKTIQSLRLWRIRQAVAKLKMREAIDDDGLVNEE